MTNDFEKQQILNYFRKQHEEYWKTVNEIAFDTGLSVGVVTDILSNSGDFVRSSYRQKAGEPLYTSRENFRDKAPFVDKLIGAFKNRID